MVVQHLHRVLEKPRSVARRLGLNRADLQRRFGGTRLDPDRLLRRPPFDRDFLLVTLDSLRYDVAAECMAAGRTPNFQRLLNEWEDRQSYAIYTLPSHVSMFAGAMPAPTRGPDEETELHTTARFEESRLFALTTKWQRYRDRKIRYFFEDAPNIARGFTSKGYDSIGVGGVGWFSTEAESSGFWRRTYFEHFLYEPSYGPNNAHGFEEQIADLEQLLATRPKRKRRFIFVNVGSTHLPYENGDGTQTTTAQAKCLEYVDRHLPSLLDLLRPDTVGVVTSDHGDCMGEDGLWGHQYPHEKVLNVPYAQFGFDSADGD